MGKQRDKVEVNESNTLPETKADTCQVASSHKETCLPTPTWFLHAMWSYVIGFGETM